MLCVVDQAVNNSQDFSPIRARFVVDNFLNNISEATEITAVGPQEPDSCINQLVPSVTRDVGRKILEDEVTIRVKQLRTTDTNRRQERHHPDWLEPKLMSCVFKRWNKILW